MRVNSLALNTKIITALKSHATWRCRNENCPPASFALQSPENFLTALRNFFFFQVTKATCSAVFYSLSIMYL